MIKSAAEYREQVENFINKLDDPTEKKQAEETFTRLIRSHEREDSFASKFIPFQTIVPEDCQISLNTANENLEYVVYKEPDAAAQYYTWQGSGDSEYIYGERVAIPIGTFGSRKFEKSEDELLVYKGIGLVEMVEQNAAKEVSTIQDKIFLSFARNAVKNNGLDLSIAGGITKNDFLDLINAPLQKKLRGHGVLMTETTFNNFLKQDSAVFGDQLQSDIIVNGFKFRNILGKQIVTTIKNDLLHDNEVFSFPAPEFLGKALVLEDTKYVVKKEDGIVSWHCKKKFGMLFVNINGVARLKLNGFAD